MNYFNPELQLKDTESAIKKKLITLLPKLREFKFVATLVLDFNKTENDDETKFATLYPNSKAETAINKSDIYVRFELTYTTIISNTQKYLGEASG